MYQKTFRVSSGNDHRYHILGFVVDITLTYNPDLLYFVRQKAMPYINILKPFNPKGK